ncbi:hypothetical protein BpHYR1_011503 [Brachionus plicatilis]|uniref:Uncharacterized protein n=1 Tax=Brachionus plicatilis TaxID=10195 RepID=A0A3M7S4G2_BRAPC|nr:hypothetical protein BpHYR1_011503 [Brachionus plicatilis]
MIANQIQKYTRFCRLVLNGMLPSSGFASSEFASQIASLLSGMCTSLVLFLGFVCCLSLSISKSSSL